MPSNRPMRYAAIDIGTVTCRMLVADVTEIDVTQATNVAQSPSNSTPDASSHLHIEEIAKEYEVVNLGEGTDSTGMLSEAAMDRAISAISGFIKLRDDLCPSDQASIPTMTVSTSAARDAKNSSTFSEKLENLGIDLNVIPGSMEAALSFAGATLFFQRSPVIVIDVGGGSTEIAIGIGGGKPAISRSFDIGCRRITERYLYTYPPAPDKLDEARAFIRQVFTDWFESPEVKKILSELGKLTVIAVAGTATSIVAIRDRIEPYDSSRVDGEHVTLEELRTIESDLAPMTLEQIENVAGLDPRRASVIVAGMMILGEAVRACGASAYTASEHDILDGIIMYNFQEHEEARGSDPD